MQEIKVGQMWQYEDMAELKENTYVVISVHDNGVVLRNVKTKITFDYNDLKAMRTFTRWSLYSDVIDMYDSFDVIFGKR